MDVLKVDNLVKTFGPPAGGFTVVDNISFADFSFSFTIDWVWSNIYWDSIAT